MKAVTRITFFDDNGEKFFGEGPEHPSGNLGCVLMASGLGKRFGSNKLMADFCGKPMICRILDNTEGIFAKRVVVTRHADIADLCRERGIQVVLHDLPLRNDTIRLGLNALGNVSGCMLCPCDQPLLRRETIVSLIRSALNDPDSMWRLCFENTPGAPVLFPQWTFPELLTLPEGQGGRWVLKKHPEKVAMLPVSDPYELMDADTPETLDELRRISFR